MTHRWNNSSEPSRTIHCAVVEVPAMDDPYDPRPQRGFQELVPWADPYIAALIDKLRREDDWDRSERGPVGELPPPLDSSDDADNDHRRGGWAPRNWPGR
ncbi:MAG: hypothetical protein AB7O59_17990 [Pirellulales bacterium]